VAKLSVTLKRSLIGRPQTQRKTVWALGLRKMHQTVLLADTPSHRGMVKAVEHLLEWKIVEESTASM
jgi:large subunit ribosomal protein L30